MTRELILSSGGGAAPAWTGKPRGVLAQVLAAFTPTVVGATVLAAWLWASWTRVKGAHGLMLVPMILMGFLCASVVSMRIFRSSVPLTARLSRVVGAMACVSGVGALMSFAARDRDMPVLWLGLGFLCAGGWVLANAARGTRRLGVGEMALGVVAVAASVWLALVAPLLCFAGGVLVSVGLGRTIASPR